MIRTSRMQEKRLVHLLKEIEPLRSYRPRYKQAHEIEELLPYCDTHNLTRYGIERDLIVLAERGLIKRVIFMRGGMACHLFAFDKPDGNWVDLPF